MNARSLRLLSQAAVLFFIGSASGLTLSAQTFKGTFLGSHSVKSTWVKSGSCNTTRPSTLSTSFSTSPFDTPGIPSNFSCDPHRFISGSATVAAPSGDVMGTIAAGPADPTVVSLSGGVAAEATLMGTGRFLEGGDRHAVRIGVNLGVDDRFPEDRRESRDSSCAAADGVANQQAGSTSLSASAACMVPAMDIDGSSIKKEMIGGVETITEFEAEVVSELYVVMDHGSATQKKNISKGAIYTITIRSRYLFESADDRVTVSEPLPPLDEPLSPEEGHELQVTADYQLGSADMGDLIVHVFDQAGRRIGASDPVSVQRGADSRRLGTLAFTLPDGVESVVLRVFLRDLAGKVLAESEPLTWQTSTKLSINHMEVVQVIQTRNNGIPLIANKRTAVRVFTQSGTGKPQSNVTVELRGRRGSDLPGSPMRITAASVPQPRRAEDAHSHDFILPPSWTVAGETQLIAVVNPDKKPPEFEFEDNEETFTASFAETKRLEVRTVEICYQCGDGTFCANGNTPSPGLGAQKMFPIEDPGINIQPFPSPPLMFQSNTSLNCFGGMGGRGATVLDAVSENRLSSLLGRNYWVARADNPSRPFDQLIGWVPGDVATWNGGLEQRFTFDPRGAWVKEEGSIDWRQITVAHELGHNLGLTHPGPPDGCKGNQTPLLGGIWPFADANLQEHGYDPRASDVKVGIPTSGKTTSKDLMSYCEGRRWISEFYYLRLMGRFSLSSGLHERVEQSVPRRVALISGSATSDGSAGTLEPALTFETAAEISSFDPAGEYCLAIDGAAAATHCFDLDFRGGETPVALAEASFVFVAPFPDGASGITLQRDGAQLDVLRLSANAPEPTITSPEAGSVWDAALPQTVAWTATDADGDALVYDLSYSSDGGVEWFPIALGLTETQYAVDASLIDGGADVRFRVRALDGLNSGEAVAGPIEVLQRPAIAAEDPTDLGRVVAGATATRTLAIQNPGSGPLTITSLTLDDPQFEILSPTFPAIARAGRELTVSVQISPEAEGDIEANAEAASDAPDTPLLSFLVRATADDGQTPYLEMTEGPLSFGGVFVGETAVYAAAVRNTSLAEADVTVSVSGDGFGLTSEPNFTLAGGDVAYLEVSFASSSEGLFQGELRVQSSDAGQPLRTIGLSASGLESEDVSTGPRISAGGVVDGAQFAATLSRGGLGSIFGQNLADANAGAAGLPLPTELGGVRVRVNGVDAPLLFVSAGQINFQMPFEAPLDGSVEVVVVRNGEASAPVSATVAPYAPALFLSNGAPIIQRHPDLDLISASNPAQPGDVLIIFMTGIGDLSNAPASGSGAPGSPPATAKILPTATIGGVAAPVLFAGLAPGFVGLGQVNIRVPETLAAPLSEEGSVGQASGLPLVLDFNGATNPSVNIGVDIGGVPLPRMAVSPSSLAFGEVGLGESKDLALMISNPGAADLVISQPTINDPQFQLVGVLSLVISPSGQQTATVRFAPDSGGAKSATLTIAGNDPANPMITVPLSGEGAADAGPEDLQVSPSPIEFGAVNIGSSAAQTVTISNSGTQSIRVVLIRATDAQFRIEFPDKTPPVDLSPGASFFIRVVFEPASAGLTESALLVSSQLFGNNITLRGTGVSSDAPSISIPSPLLFGPVPVGRVVEKTISVSNNGTASLVVSAATSDDPQFMLGDVELPFTVLPGEQQAVQVHYEPAAVGSHEATLLFESNDPGQANKPLTVIGEGTAGEPVLFSDSFERPDGVNCAVGSADHAFGGSGFHGYAMIASGARLRGGLLENASREYGGVSFTTQSGGSCPGEGSDQGADLNIRADVLVPRAGARTTQAGPFFHAPLLGSGQRIDEGGAAGYWVQLDSSGEVQVRRLDTFQQVAVSDAPADFDASLMHTIEVAVRGQSAEVTIDGRLRLFRQGAGVSGRSTVNVIPTAGSNDGGAGLAFGAEDGPASPGGQQLDNIRVSGYETLLGAPVERTP